MTDELVAGPDGRRRCAWAGSDPLYVAYHDEEWGVPIRTEQGLYERLCLEGFQAGLAWITVLRKRDRFREVFAGFDPEQVAHFDADDVTNLLADPGIIRHRGKIEAAITNAKATIRLRDTYEGGLVALIWSVAGQAATTRPSLRDTQPSTGIPTYTEAARALARDLKEHGYSFVGPTTVYAALQACGVVNDHVAGCYRST